MHLVSFVSLEIAFGKFLAAKMAAFFNLSYGVLLMLKQLMFVSIDVFQHSL